MMQRSEAITCVLGSFLLFGSVAACDATPDAPPESAHRRSADVADNAEPSRGTDAPALPPPTRTRTGSLRFASPEVEDPRMAGVLLERLGKLELGSDERSALVEALPRTGGEWQAEVLARYPNEKDAAVRQVMVAIMRRAGAPVAEAGVLLGLRDSSPSVRAEAATTASLLRGNSGGSATLQGALRAALADDDAMVRAGTARSLGVLSVTGSFDQIASLLADASPEVRLHAVTALRRLDANKARALPALQVLEQDADERVARAARAARQ